MPEDTASLGRALPDEKYEVDVDEHAFSAARVVLLTALAMSLFAAAVSTQTYLAMLDHGHSLVRILVWQLATWNLWAVAAPWAVRGGWRTSGASAPVRFGRLVALGVFLIAAHNVLAAQLTVWLQPYMPVEAYDYAQAFALQLPSLFTMDLLIYALLVGSGVVAAARNRARALEVRDSRLQADLARAQLEALRLEIHPHFLFNTLNSVAALIRSRDDAGALDTLVGFSDLLRATIDREPQAFVTLESEIEFLARYVNLQRRRFGSRLEVVFSVPDECRAIEVPAFLLQPLVENALRHGMANRSHPCRVEIGARLGRSRCLHLWVSDDGTGLPPDFQLERDAGTGLRNAKSRLQQFYGRAATLDIRPNAEAGARVELVLPLSAHSRSAGGAA